MLIATGFYSGYLPKAPGTWGSLVGLVGEVEAAVVAVVKRFLRQLPVGFIHDDSLPKIIRARY